MEALVESKMPPVVEDEQLDFYIRTHYLVGLKVSVCEDSSYIKSRGTYHSNTNEIYISSNIDGSSSDQLDRALCHEFIHCLTMCGSEELGTIHSCMDTSMYEPITEMLSTEIMDGDYPSSYTDFCQIIQFINKLAGVTDYRAFLNRNLDDKYQDFSSVFDQMQDYFDYRSFSDGGRKYGQLHEEDKKEIISFIITLVSNKDYSDLNDLIDKLIPIYSLRGFYSIDSIHQIHEYIVDHYLKKQGVDDEQMKQKIMQLLDVKNRLHLIDNRDFSIIHVDDDQYYVDPEGNLYYFDEHIVNKLERNVIPYNVFNGEVDIVTSSGIKSFDLSTFDFKVLGLDLKRQQTILESELIPFIRKKDIHKPYISPDTYFTVVERESDKKHLNRPHICDATISLLQDKFHIFELNHRRDSVHKMLNDQLMGSNQLATLDMVSNEHNTRIGL